MIWIIVACLCSHENPLHKSLVIPVLLRPELVAIKKILLDLSINIGYNRVKIHVVNPKFCENQTCLTTNMNMKVSLVLNFVILFTD